MKNLAITAIIVFALILGNFFGGGAVKNSFLSLTEKPSIFLSGKLFEIKIFLKSVFDYSSIINENKNLYAENYKLLIRLAEINSISDRYEQIKKQLSLNDRSSKKLEPVNVFLFSYDPDRAGAFIDKGADEGISIGQAVIYGGNILIGTVEEIFQSYSRISLVTDPRTQINAKTSSGSFVLAKGSINDGILLDFVAKDEEITEGEYIFTSGLDGLSENLLIGKVKKIGLNEGSLFKKIFIAPAFKEVNSSHAFLIK